MHQGPQHYYALPCALGQDILPHPSHCTLDALHFCYDIKTDMCLLVLTVGHKYQTKTAGYTSELYCACKSYVVLRQNSCRVKHISVCNVPLSEMGKDQPQYMSQTADTDTARVKIVQNRYQAM